MTWMKVKLMSEELVQFDRRLHGGLWDRGSADAYYKRPPKPHWYPDGTYNCDEVTELTQAEIAEYMAGYQDQIKSGDFKDYD